MIFVALGTQDKSFTRLLNAVQASIDDKTIKEEVIVQAGHTKYDSKDMKIFDLLPKEEYEKVMSESKVMIVHGGVSSILDGLKNNKKVIAAARLSEFNEHKNNHQQQIIDKMEKGGYIKALNDFSKLSDILKNIDKFKPKKYPSNTQKIINLISKFIDNN